MLSPYRIQPIINIKRLKMASNTNIDSNSHCEYEHKRPQLSSNDLKRSQMTPTENVKSLESKNEYILKAG